MKNASNQNTDYWFLEPEPAVDNNVHLPARRRIEAGPHPSESMLYDYVLDWLEETEAGIIGKHLMLCGVCAETVLRIRQVEGSLEQRLSEWTKTGDDAKTWSAHIVSQSVQTTIATEYWEPQMAGQLATAAYMPAQEHLFRREDGDIKVSCFWRAQYSDKPAFIKILWNANIKVRSEILAHFINPETHELHSEISLGTQLAGEEWLTSHELGFDPSTEKWAIAIIVKELEE